MAQKNVNGQILDVPEIDSKKADVAIGTILRLLFLIAAYVNQACDVLGAYDSFLTEDTKGLVTVVSLIATAVASVAAYWFNNSWTPEATVIDKVFAIMKFTSKYCPDIADAVKNNIIDAHKANTELMVSEASYRDRPHASNSNPVNNNTKMQN